MNIAKKIGVKAKFITKGDIEDFFIAIVIKEGETSKFVATDEALVYPGG